MGFNKAYIWKIIYSIIMKYRVGPKEVHGKIHLQSPSCGLQVSRTYQVLLKTELWVMWPRGWTPATHPWIRSSLVSFSSSYSPLSLVSLVHQSVVTICLLGTPSLLSLTSERRLVLACPGARGGSSHRDSIPEVPVTGLGVATQPEPVTSWTFSNESRQKRFLFLFGHDPGKT